jgi:hypothetical protein
MTTTTIKNIITDNKPLFEAGSMFPQAKLAELFNFSIPKSFTQKSAGNFSFKKGHIVAAINAELIKDGRYLSQYKHTNYRVLTPTQITAKITRDRAAIERKQAIINTLSK